MLPTVKYLAKFTRPSDPNNISKTSGPKNDSGDTNNASGKTIPQVAPFPPSLAWTWTNIAARPNAKQKLNNPDNNFRKASPATIPCPVLAVGWGDCVQIFRVQIHRSGNKKKMGAKDTSEDSYISAMAKISLSGSSDGQDANAFQLKPFLMSTISISTSPLSQPHLVPSHLVTALDWMSDTALLYMNTNDEICLYDTSSSEEVERKKISKMVSHRTQDSKNFPPSFQNSFRGCAGNVYLLGMQQLCIAKEQSWKERIDALTEAGEWISALVLALDRFDAVTKPRKGAGGSGAIQDPCPKGSPTRIALDDTLERILLDYADISLADLKDSSRQLENNARTNDRFSTSPYQIVGGVCIDFCSTVDRTDLLFGQIYEQFCAAGVDKQNIFLELLEPYILNDRLHAMPATVMQAFVEHYSDRSMLSQVEQCILHMNVSQMNLDGVIRLCQKHQLFSALIYVYNHGISEYVIPAEVLFDTIEKNDMLQEGGRESVASIDLIGRSSSSLSNVRATSPMFAYKLLLYLKYCFKGLSFPRGKIKKMCKQAIHAELLKFLFEAQPKLSRSLMHFAKTQGGDQALKELRVKWRKHSYPRLRTLLSIDAAAFLKIVSTAFECHDIYMAKLKSLLAEDKKGEDRASSSIPSIPGRGRTKSSYEAGNQRVKTIAARGKKDDSNHDEFSSSSDDDEDEIMQRDWNQRLRLAAKSIHCRDKNRMNEALVKALDLHLYDSLQDSINIDADKQEARNAYFIFVSEEIAKGSIKARKEILTAAIRFLINRSSDEPTVTGLENRTVGLADEAGRRHSQVLLVKLFEVSDPENYDCGNILSTIRKKLAEKRAKLQAHKLKNQQVQQNSEKTVMNILSIDIFCLNRALAVISQKTDKFADLLEALLAPPNADLADDEVDVVEDNGDLHHRVRGGYTFLSSPRHGHLSADSRDDRQAFHRKAFSSIMNKYESFMGDERDERGNYFANTSGEVQIDKKEMQMLQSATLAHLHQLMYLDRDETVKLIVLLFSSEEDTKRYDIFKYPCIFS